MGSDASVIVVDAPPGLARAARRRLEELEARWSRFQPTSEISRLNAAGGRPLAVSPDTLHLVCSALEAWRVSDGAYDPTVLGDLLRAGYTVTFEDLPTASATGPPAGRAGASGGPNTSEPAGSSWTRRRVRSGFHPGWDSIRAGSARAWPPTW